MHYYIEPLIKLYYRKSDPEQAEPMSRYMKNQFPFLGLKTPRRKELMRSFYRQNGFPELEDLPGIVLQLWDLPEREFQYTAQGMLVRFRAKLGPEAVDLYEKLLVKKSWWDTVDLIATNLVGPHFQRYPQLTDKHIDKWMNSNNIWLQRTCLLFQLGYKDRTDFNLLSRLIIRLSGTREFFLNKAIGWSLREYSKTDAETVIEFVENHELAPLSRREALKWLKNHKKL